MGGSQSSQPLDGNGAQPVSVGVRDNILTYDIPNGTDGECHFYIVSSGGGAHGVFQYSRGGVVLRQHTSRTFPTGSITVANQRRENGHFVVKVNKTVDLNEYFR